MRFILNNLFLFLNRPFIEQINLLFGLLFLLFLFPEGSVSTIQKFILILPAITLLFLQGRMVRKVFWCLSGFIFLLDTLTDHTLISNHGFLFGYMSFAIFLSYTIPEERQEQFLKEQFLWAFAIAMIFSGIQKFVSPRFMDGSFLSLLFIKGGIAGFALEPFNETHLKVVENASALTNFSETDPTAVNMLKLDPIWPWIQQYMRPISWSVAILEALVGVLAIPFINKRFFHVLVFLLAFGILFTRQETGFLALIAALMIYSMASDMKRMQLAYLGFIILCISLVAAGMGSS